MRKDRESSRLRRRRLLAATVGDIIPSDDELIAPEDREDVNDEIQGFLDDFEDLYNDKLLNYVRNGLPNELKPLYEELAKIQQLLATDQETITENLDDVKRALNTSAVKVKSSATSVKRIMRTIVQQCNEIIRAMGL